MGSNGSFPIIPFFLFLHIVFFGYLTGHASCECQNSMACPNAESDSGSNSTPALTPSPMPQPPPSEPPAADTAPTPTAESPPPGPPNADSPPTPKPESPPSVPPPAADPPPPAAGSPPSPKPESPPSVPPPAADPPPPAAGSPPSPKPESPPSGPSASNAKCSTPTIRFYMCRFMLTINRSGNVTFGMAGDSVCCSLLRSIPQEEISGCLCRAVKDMFLGGNFLRFAFGINVQLPEPCGLTLTSLQC